MTTPVAGVPNGCGGGPLGGGGGGGGQNAKPEEPDDDLDLNLAEGSVAANVARRVREGNLIGDDLEVAAGAARGTTTCQYGPIHGI